MKSSTTPPCTRAASTWAVCAALMLSFAVPAQAQNFGDRLRRTVERAAEGEVQRRADRETRRVVRCATGDDACVEQARREGSTVEMVQSPAGGGAPVGGSRDTGGDHPLITPYAGSRMGPRTFEDYNEYHRIVGVDNAARALETQRLEGRLTRIRYNNPSGRSTFEIIRNYRAALESRGFRPDWECNGRAECGTTWGWSRTNGLNVGVGGDVRYFTGKLSWNDVDAYVSVGVNPHYTWVHVLESTPMDTGMVQVSADALAAGLEADGRIELQGIYFDTGQASLRPESNAAIEQVAQLLRQQPGLQLRVVGHTDSSGDFQANVNLSQERAEAVRLALVGSHGIDAARLTAQGVGPSVPVASNDTEEGRARNRRVELVKP
jgi:OmpA-OmpF porin, OOP family